MNLCPLRRVIRAAAPESHDRYSSLRICECHPGREFQIQRASDAFGGLSKCFGLARRLGATLIVIALAVSAQGQTSVTLAWNSSTGTNIVGYKIYYGAASRTYTNTNNVGNVTNATISSLISGTTYYFAVTAYNTSGLESDYSTEVVYTNRAAALPTIVMSSPASGAGYAAPATIISLAATVTANGHTITQVQFYNGATLLGAVATAPYSLAWTNVSAGNYSLTAKAIYDSGSTVGSTAANVTIAARRPSFAADSGTFTAPFVDSNGTLSQPATTGVTNGGRVAYSFTIANAGNYLVSAMVRAPSLSENSFYVNIDSEPVDPLMIWDIPICTNLAIHTVSWRGNGNGDPALSQYIPKVFTLSAGTHQIIIRGREANTTLGNISIAATPPRLKILVGFATGGVTKSSPTPSTSVTLSATGQPGQMYNVLCSQDLMTWTLIGTMTLDATGSGQFSAPAGTGLPHRFYRLQDISIAATPPKLKILVGSGATGTVTKSAPPTSTSVTLSATGQPGQMYNVLCSQDLMTWTLIGTMTLDATGSGQFTALASTSLPHRFYRLQGQ